MARPRSKALDYLIYLVIRIFVCFIQFLSFETACGLSRWLARLVYRLDKRHRLVALDNLQHAFGEQLTPAERERMVLAVYEHFLRLVIELIHCSRRLWPHNWQDHLTLGEHGRDI